MSTSIRIAVVLAFINQGIVALGKFSENTGGVAIFYLVAAVSCAGLALIFAFGKETSDVC